MSPRHRTRRRAAKALRRLCGGLLRFWGGIACRGSDGPPAVFMTPLRGGPRRRVKRPEARLGLASGFLTAAAFLRRKDPSYLVEQCKKFIIKRVKTKNGLLGSKKCSALHNNLLTKKENQYNIRTIEGNIVDLLKKRSALAAHFVCRESDGAGALIFGSINYHLEAVWR